MDNIIIVGGSNGIGLALCQMLVNEGKTLVNISRTPCRVAGVGNMTADVCDADALEAAFGSIEQADALVYCAGMSMAAPVEYADRADYVKLFDTNTVGAIDCCRLALPKLKSSADGGRIVLLSSSGGIAPIPFDSFYTASKAALTAFSRALCLETDVKCTAAVIGGTRTQFSFKRKVYRNCGEYDKKLKNAANTLIKTEQSGYEATFVAKKLLKILNSDDPPPVVTIGAKNKLQTLFYKLLPERIAKAAVKKMYF